MKFSQYIEAEKILKNQGLSFNEIKSKSKKQLNEIFGINKALLSWGIKGILSNKLKKQAENFKKDLIDSSKKAIEKLKATKKEMESRVQKDTQGKIPLEISRKIATIELQFINIIIDNINKLSLIKTKEITNRIEKSTKMKESAKLGLKYLWQKLMSDIKIYILLNLMKEKIISVSTNIQGLKNAIGEEDTEMKEKAREINDKIKDISQEKKEEINLDKKEMDTAEAMIHDIEL